jgi:hypothetical protein
MAIYRLGCVIGVSAVTEVEAESEAEAIEIAKVRQAVISAHGEGDVSEQWLVEEADGEPDEIHVSERISD